ncbi:hypothetical protein SVIO_000910 [Streptomyces violaceusniger]|uniref:Uncharacterized protein n=1 Tax=Streptomyces violaceusniger TaxID=68280 RepID=A0A4D4KSQ8_STRVO|nr:hypothetical protein SVIO_000910 [Streptomyces violaceusniger]
MGTWDHFSMPRSNNDQLPATYVASGNWPYARLVEDAPDSAHYGQAFARNLAEAMETSEIGLRALGDKAGVSHATISRLLRGMVLPDLGLSPAWRWHWEPVSGPASQHGPSANTSELALRR